MKPHFSSVLIVLLFLSLLFGTASAASISDDPDLKSVSQITNGMTVRVSVSSEGVEGNATSNEVSISAEGRYVAFYSAASNLVADDTNGRFDVFLHDRQTGETSRVSVASGGVQGTGDSSWPSITPDGRYVAFFSQASNLVANDTNAFGDVFVRDRQAGTTSRISVGSDGTEGDGHSGYGAISADGRYVTFYSAAGNLVAGDTNDVRDIFVHDRQTGTTTRVSVASDGTQADGESVRSAISSDGRYVAFCSGASNLVASDTNGYYDAFVHDRNTGETFRVSVASDGTEGNLGMGSSTCSDLSISADGRIVVFPSYSDNLVENDTNGKGDIFAHDLQTGETTIISVAADGTQGDFNPSNPEISADGRYVTFESRSSTLVEGDTNNNVDVFVHDRQTGVVTRASVASDGTQGNDTSWYPAISADGQHVAFGSRASTLVAGDTNGVYDVFVHDLVAPPVAITDLQANAGSAAGEISLAWTAPANIAGDMSYQVKYADSPLVSELGWASAAAVTGVPSPESAGSPQSMVVKNLTAGQTYYFAVRVEYDGGSLSPLSNSPGAVPASVKGIDLSVSLYRSVGVQERDAYEEIFGYFADAVFEMSNGVHKIGTITVYQNGESAATADVLWNNSEWPRAIAAGFDNVGQQVWMGDIFPFGEDGGTDYNALDANNRQGAGYTLAHEWGHYYYGLYDEYRDPKCGFLCSLNIKNPRPNDFPVHNSVMNLHWAAVSGNFNWLNFSVVKNIGGDTAQRRVYEASGWETLMRQPSEDPRSLRQLALPRRGYYPELASVAPDTGEDSSLELNTTPTSVTRGALNITWVEPAITANGPQAAFNYWATVSSVTGSEVTYPQPVLLVASVAASDPIAQATVLAAAVTPEGGSVPLLLLDDGTPPDAVADDGFYSGYMPYPQNGTYTVTATFDNQAGNAFFTQLSAAPSVGPNGETFTPTFTPVGEDFSATAVLTVEVSGVQADDHGDTPETATLTAADNVDVPGRMDRAGDADVFKVVPSHTGWLSIRMSNLGLGMEPHIRLLTANGTTVLGDFTVTPTAASYFFTWLEATAGQPFYVEVTHVDSSATEGYYDVSVGQPLLNEHSELYLPMMIRP